MLMHDALSLCVNSYVHYKLSFYIINTHVHIRDCFMHHMWPNGYTCDPRAWQEGQNPEVIPKIEKNTFRKNEHQGHVI